MKQILTSSKVGFLFITGMSIMSILLQMYIMLFSVNNNMFNYCYLFNLSFPTLTVRLNGGTWSHL